MKTKHAEAIRYGVVMGQHCRTYWKVALLTTTPGRWIRQCMPPGRLSQKAYFRTLGVRI